MNNTITIYPVTMLDWNEGRQQHWAIGESKEQVEGWIRGTLPASNRIMLGEPLQVSTIEEFQTHYEPSQSVWYCKKEFPEGLTKDIIRIKDC